MCNTHPALLPTNGRAIVSERAEAFVQDVSLPVSRSLLSPATGTSVALTAPVLAVGVAVGAGAARLPVAWGGGASEPSSSRSAPQPSSISTAAMPTKYAVNDRSPTSAYDRSSSRSS